MKKYWKLMVGIVAFAALFAVAGLAYHKLSEDYNAGVNLVVMEDEESRENKEGKEDKDNASTTDSVEEETPTEENPSEGGNSESEAGTGENGTADEVTEQVPNFTVETFDGEEVKLHDFFGKPIVLNFWASWCGPCKMELPDFQAAYEKYDGTVVFLMVNMTDGAQETKKSASEYMAEAGYTLPVYYDTLQDAAYTYGIYSLPTTFFINERGEAVAYAQGMIDAQTLETGISMILE